MATKWGVWRVLGWYGFHVSSGVPMPGCRRPRVAQESSFRNAAIACPRGRYAPCLEEKDRSNCSRETPRVSGTMNR